MEASLSLLLVEDSQGDADLATEYLQAVPNRTFLVQHEKRLTSAVAQLKTRPFDAVVLDLNLPDSEGLETLEEVRRYAGHAPIVVLTGLSPDERLQRQVLELGAEDLICKNERASRLLARSVLYAVERRHAERGQRRIQQLIAANPDALIVTDEQGTVLFVNPAAELLFGKTRSEFLDKSAPFSVVDSQPSEIEIAAPGGTRRIGETRVAPFDWEGRPAYLASVRDITEQKSLGEQLRAAQKLEAVGRLAGGIAHDFNNLLMVMISFATFVRDSLPGDSPCLADIGEVLTTARRATDLTRQLLAFSRRQPATPQVLDLNAALKNLQRMLERTMGEDVTVVSDLDPSIGFVYMDPGQLEQVVINLAVNARDAMPNGGRLCIETSPDPSPLKDHELVFLRVRDTGIGMSDEVRDNAFQPFFTTKETGRGTGIGLSVVHGIVTQAGGTVRVESALGKGACFEIQLPRCGPGMRPFSSTAPPARDLHGTETILLVEDDPSVRRGIKRMLAKYGYCTIEAENGAQAIQRYAQHCAEIDLVLMDVIMPQMNGQEAAAEIRKRAPALPILFMSGYLNDAFSKPGFEVHTAELVEKPFSEPALLSRVRRALDNRA